MARLLDKLCFIQQRIASQGTLSLEHGILPEDIEAVERLFKILSSGRSAGQLSLSAKLNPDRSAPGRSNAGEGTLALAVDSPPISLLGVDVRLGKARIVPVDPTVFFKEYEARRREANRTGKAVKLTLVDLPVIEEYIEWTPDELRWERLSETAAKQGGYCTLAQARWVGYADERLPRADPRWQGPRVRRRGLSPRTVRELGP